MRSDFRIGVESGVNGTPIFFINGERYNGAWNNAEGFIDALNQMAQSGTSSRSAS